MSYLWLFLLLVLVIAGWLMTVFSMPGNWVIVLTAALFAWLVPANEASGIGMSWTAVLILLVLAIVGEVHRILCRGVRMTRGGEQTAGGGAGHLRLGGRGPDRSVRKGTAHSRGRLGGGRHPIRQLRRLVERHVGRMAGKVGHLAQALEVGQGAFWGRLLGALAKTTVASVMAAVAVVAAIFFKSF